MRALLPLVTLFAASPALAGGPMLTIDGECPGRMGFTIAGVEPGSTVAILTGTGDGAAALPGGPCAGAVSDLSGLNFITTMRDSDGDGSILLSPMIPDGACGLNVQVVDVATCSFTNVATLGDDGGVCTPDVEVDDMGPAGDMIEPVYFGLTITGIPFGGDLLDWHDTESGEDIPAWANFNFYDAAVGGLCTVQFDAARLVAEDPTAWDSDSGGRLYAAYSLDVGGGGWTNCGPVDPGVFGTSDLRVWAATAADFGAALGDITPAVGDPLRDAVVASGGDWVADWEPNVFGAYIYWDGLARELGYAFSYGHECGEVVDPTPMPAPTSTLEGRLVQSRDYFVWPIDSL